MKILILTSSLLFIGAGILCAGSHCQTKDHNYINKFNPKFVLTLNNLQLLKHYDKYGNDIFTIKNLDGDILAENISRLELIVDFPEIEKKFKS